MNFKKCKQTFFARNWKKVGKLSFFGLLFKYFKMLQNPGKCLCQFFLTFYLCSCLFPNLKGFQWLKTQMQLFFRVRGSTKFLLENSILRIFQSLRKRKRKMWCTIFPSCHTRKKIILLSKSLNIRITGKLTTFSIHPQC